MTNYKLNDFTLNKLVAHSRAEIVVPQHGEVQLYKQTAPLDKSLAIAISCPLNSMNNQLLNSLARDDLFEFSFTSSDQSLETIRRPSS